ncbi:MAG TPA: hypothetical protein VJN93_08100 [Candidatus Acidoferrum sp.]|nr:hypothetical protein [Candidatus Acidoferrum sp.]
MGNEIECRVRFGKEASKGKALLETNEILFRGDFRLKIPFASIKSAKAADGELHLLTANGLAVFELGSLAEKWREKILHPKTRIEKLGVKPGETVALVGGLEKQFFDEIKALGAFAAKGNSLTGVSAIFLEAESRAELSRLAKLANSLKGAASLWVVYPKGRKDITENDVLTAGRKGGLKDVKVVGFSATHTALKFVLPLDKR